MNRFLTPLLALVVISGLAVPTMARAYPIWVKFSFGYQDPLGDLRIARGTFTLDSELGGYGIYDYSGLGASSVCFPFDGHTWTSSDADLIEFHLSSVEDSKGMFWTFDSLPFHGYYDGFAPMFDLLAFGKFDDVDGLYHGSLEFHFTSLNMPGVFMGNGTWTAGIPEPGGLWLFGGGVLVLGLIRRRAGRLPPSAV